MNALKSILCITIFCIVFEGCNKWQSYVDKTGLPLAEIITTMGTIVVELDPERAPLTVENFIGLAEGTREWLDPISARWTKKPFYDGLIFHKIIPDFSIQSGCPLNNGSGGPGYTFPDETMDYTNAVNLTGRIDTEEKAVVVYDEVIAPYLKNSLRDKRIKDSSLYKITRECSDNKNVRPIMRYTVEYYLEKTGRTEPVRFGGTVKSRIVYGSLCMANKGPDSNGSQFFIVTGKNGAPWLDGKHTVFGRVILGMDVALKIQNIQKYPDGRPVKEVAIEEIKIYKRR